MNSRWLQKFGGRNLVVPSDLRPLVFIWISFVGIFFSSQERILWLRSTSPAISWSCNSSWVVVATNHFSILQMSTPGNEGSGTSKSKGRRGWTVQEENYLVLAFKDIIASGWKAPNGFRSGFIAQLEARFKDYLPRTDIKAEPHISSKYTSWKKTYHQISNALSFSGMNWNSTTCTIEAEPSEWDSFLQQFPNHSSIRGKPYPLYESWVEIYGRDRATGQSAMDWATAAPQTPIDITADTVVQNCASGFPTQATVLGEQEVNQGTSAGTPSTPATGTSEKKKRKRSDRSSDIIVEALTNFCNESTSSILAVASKLGAAKDTIKRQEDIFEAIGSLPMHIDIQDHIKVSNMLVNNTSQMNMFFGMNTDARMVMVQMAIEGTLR